MGASFRVVTGRTGKTIGAILGVVTISAFAAWIASGLPCLNASERHHIAGAKSAHAVLAGRSDAIRRDMERIHGGKVDKATMNRIVAAMLAIHEHAMSRRNDGEGGHFQTASLQISDSVMGASTALPDAISAFLQKTESTDAGTASTPVYLAENSGSASVPPSDDAAADNRTYVGQKTCETCHQQEAGNWAHTIHAKIFGLNPRNSTEAQGCEACHGPGSEHLKNPADFSKIISFSHKSKTPVARQNAQCLSCHQGGQRIFWHASIHQTNNVGCSDCHNPMTNFSAHGLTARESINDTCFQCHKVQRAQFNQRSHMPLLEGKLSCVDCHNPHGSTTRPLLKADSTNELCYSCHAEKRGPFLFEHAPVRENCLNCHNPHGSNFEALLTAPRPLLCQQCHSQSGHPAQLMTRGNLPGGPMPDPRLIATSCQTCHVNIHGSNHPSGSRFER
jgi:DmsE family decaheme c-type cytochrome